MTDRPTGVTAVGILTLLGGFGYFFLGAFLFLLGAVGGPPASVSGGLPLLAYIVMLAPFVLAISEFLLSIGILSGAKAAWYIAILYWISRFAFSAYVMSLVMNREFLWFGEEWRNFLLLLLPYLLSMILGAVFVMYFQTRKVKDFFDV